MITYKDIKENSSMDFRKKTFEITGYVKAYTLQEALKLFENINSNEGQIMVWEAE